MFMSSNSRSAENPDTKGSRDSLCFRSASLTLWRANPRDLYMEPVLFWRVKKESNFGGLRVILVG